jgi:ubiquinone/menaquinone biosynthesis C-methylase UbiE
MAEVDDLRTLKQGSADFERLLRYSIGFYGVWIAHIGRQMKLFDGLSDRPMTIDELIFTTGLYSPAVRVWCSAAYSYGLVTIKKGKLQLKKQVKAMLVDKTSPHYLGGQFSYLALKSLEYGAFEDLFKYGKTRKMTTSALTAIEHATEWDHYVFLAAVRSHRKLHQVLSKGCRLLDVGCGTGSLLIKMLEEYPSSSLVGIDPSQKAVAMARKIADGKRITIAKQAGESMKFANEFEIVYLGESLYAARDKIKVISNCWRALKKDGTIAILEGLLPESEYRIGGNRLIMGMQLDFALHGHKFMNKKEITMLLNMKFSRTSFEELGGHVYLVTATKY